MANKPTVDVCLACSYDQVGETPLKHDQQFCKKIETSLVNGLVNGDKENLPSIIPEPQQQAPTTSSKNAKKKKRKKNKAAANATATNNVAPSGTTASSSTAQTPATPSPQSDTNQKISQLNSTVLPNSSLPSTQHNEELQKEVNKIVKELEELTNQKVLLHKVRNKQHSYPLF